MIIKDIFKNAKWKDIKPILETLPGRHSKDYDKYEAAFEEIANLDTTPVENPDITIDDELMNSKDHYISYFSQIDKDSLFNVFTQWNTMVSLNVLDTDIKKYGIPKLAAFILDFMTYVGKTKADADEVIGVYLKEELINALSDIERS